MQITTQAQENYPQHRSVRADPEVPVPGPDLVPDLTPNQCGALRDLFNQLMLLMSFRGRNSSLYKVFEVVRLSEAARQLFSQGSASDEPEYTVMMMLLRAIIHMGYLGPVAELRFVPRHEFKGDRSGNPFFTQDGLLHLEPSTLSSVYAAVTNAEDPSVFVLLDTLFARMLQELAQRWLEGVVPLEHTRRPLPDRDPKDPRGGGGGSASGPDRAGRGRGIVDKGDGKWATKGKGYGSSSRKGKTVEGGRQRSMMQFVESLANSVQYPFTAALMEDSSFSLPLKSKKPTRTLITSDVMEKIRRKFKEIIIGGNSGNMMPLGGVALVIAMAAISIYLRDKGMQIPLHGKLGVQLPSIPTGIPNLHDTCAQIPQTYQDFLDRIAHFKNFRPYFRFDDTHPDPSKFLSPEIPPSGDTPWRAIRRRIFRGLKPGAPLDKVCPVDFSQPPSPGMPPSGLGAVKNLLSNYQKSAAFGTFVTYAGFTARIVWFLVAKSAIPKDLEGRETLLNTQTITDCGFEAKEETSRLS